MRKFLSPTPLLIGIVVVVLAAIGLAGYGASYLTSAAAQPLYLQETSTTLGAQTPSSQAPSSSSTPSPQSILSQAAAATGNINSGTGDINVTVNITGDGSMPSDTQAFFSQPITLTGTYSFNGSPVAFDTMVTLRIGGQSVPLGLREVNGQVFVQALGQWYETSSAMMNGGAGSAINQAAIARMVQGLLASGVDVSTWLTNLTVVGQENIDGVTAYHLSGTVDVNKALSDLVNAMQKASGQNQTPSTETQTPSSESGTTNFGMMGFGLNSSDVQNIQSTVSAWLRSLTLDLWVATDTFQFRQFQVSASVVPPAGQGQGVQSAQAQATVTLNPATAPVSITAPTNVRPFSDLQQSLSTLMNMFGSSSGSSGATNPGSTETTETTTTMPSGTTSTESPTTTTSTTLSPTTTMSTGITLPSGTTASS